MKGNQVCSNKGPGPFQRGDDHKNEKMGWDLLKIFFSRTTGPILTSLGRNYPRVKGIKVCSNEGDSPSLRFNCRLLVQFEITLTSLHIGRDPLNYR
jgi:hypothetical protein